MEIASFVKVIAQSCIAEQKVGTPRYVMLPTSSEKAARDAHLSRPTILVTSGGSLVGKTVLDCLEGRRSGVRLVACNAAKDSPSLFRYDSFHIVPLTGAGGWEAAMTAVIKAEAPAVVIPGRDTDVDALADLAARQPELAKAFTGGSARMARVIVDKAETARFAAEHGLAFAPTVSTDDEGTHAAAAALANTYGFPLIAKPAQGRGSLGVRVVTCEAQLHVATGLPGIIIQPFLDCPPASDLELDTSAGIPLFWEVAEDRLYSVQFLIDRAGGILGHNIQRARLVLGRVEEVWTYENEALFAVAHAFAVKAAQQGWRGPLNVQAKRADAAGTCWKVIELNGRFSGGTSCRLHLGFDEVAMIINEWVGRPVVGQLNTVPVRHIIRELTDYPVRDTDGYCQSRELGQINAE